VQLPRHFLLSVPLVPVRPPQWPGQMIVSLRTKPSRQSRVLRPNQPPPHLLRCRLSRRRCRSRHRCRPRRARSLDALVQRHAGTKTPDREAECLAGAVYFESKGEPADGQLAVAHVILNRAKSGRFPASACGVVFQPSQFSFVRGRGFPPIARSSQQWKTAVAVSHIALNNLWMSTVSDALFFHARRVAPGWRLKRIAAVGNHVFYR
jgi:hypothetical protein